MKERIVTSISEFTDFKGQVHRFIVAAVSEQIDATVDIYDDDGNSYEYVDVQKAVKLGVSICNPTDDYDEDKGKMIAINKARNNVDYALYATLPGMINTAVVDALVKQEVEFIKANPGRVIPGYLDEKEKFETRQAFNARVAELNAEEKAFFEALITHKYPKVEALLTA